MRKKSKRTKGIEQAHPFDGMSRVNPRAAGSSAGNGGNGPCHRESGLPDVEVSG